MSTRSTHAKAPTAPTVEAQKARIQLDTILARLAGLVNRFPPVALYHELQAARSLVAAYEATAERRARQRRMLSGQKGGQR